MSIPIECPERHRTFQKALGVLKLNTPSLCLCGMRFEPRLQVQGLRETAWALQKLERAMRSP